MILIPKESIYHPNLQDFTKTDALQIELVFSTILSFNEENLLSTVITEWFTENCISTYNNFKIQIFENIVQISIIKLDANKDLILSLQYLLIRFNLKPSKLILLKRKLSSNGFLIDVSNSYTNCFIQSKEVDYAYLENDGIFRIKEVKTLPINPICLSFDNRILKYKLRTPTKFCSSLAKYIEHEIQKLTCTEVMVFNSKYQKNSVDLIRSKHKEGYFFKIPKSILIENYPQRFRYMEYEVFEALIKVVKTNDFSTTINWLRDENNFNFQLWNKI